MKKNIVRIMILTVLILVCIWQTITLWLGDVSSHNFFGNEQETSYEQYYVFPKQIWAIKSCAYIIEGNNSEGSRCYKLINELMSEIRRENVQLKSEIKISYDQLLKTQGIVYQYGMPLTLGEITGKSFAENNKEIDTKIKDIFVDVSASDNYKAYVYLIDEDDKVRYMLTLNNKLIVHAETLARFDEGTYNGQAEKYMNYQASLLSVNDSEYFKHNVFYPQPSKQAPIYYEQITFQPLIIKGGEQQLEGMVNQLFTNPIYKRRTDTDTEIVYYDNLNLSVKYNRSGTLEFKKSVSDVNEKVTAMQRMNKIMTFIKETVAVPSELKKGLYLYNIVNDGENKGITYYFKYAYENYDVTMSKHIKETLGLNAYLELTIKGDEIISGKWLMMEPQTFGNDNVDSLSIACNEVTTQMFGNKVPSESEKLENLEGVYIFDSLNDVLKFNWAAMRGQQTFIYDEKLGINEI